MHVSCDKCGCDTKPKQVTSKKNGKTYTLYECLGNCMNGKFKYSCFPPNEGGSRANNGSQSPLNANAGHSSEVLEQLKLIVPLLCSINAKLAVNKPVNKIETIDDIPFPTEAE